MLDRENNVNNLIFVSVAFALFIVCPRMAGMTWVITKAAKTNIIQVAIIGTFLSLPLLIAMGIVFKYYGLIAALGLAVLTDIGAALLMRQISLKAGLETLYNSHICNYRGKDGINHLGLASFPLMGQD